MQLHLPICVLGLGLAAAAPAHAQPYFNCEYSPRCEAIQNGQCASNRDLKDKLSLARFHATADDVERTWSVLAAFEPEYCKRLGERGNLVREFARFKAKPSPELQGGDCADAAACAETFVRATRERWQRDDLDVRIKAELERNSRAAARGSEPPQAEAIAPGTWQTTTTAAVPAGS
jgi:hypothetical protein